MKTKSYNHFRETLWDLRGFLPLWGTQALSGLGSAMTSFALVIWSYRQAGSALTTALLTVCSYAPYVLLSLFAGTLSDRWNRRIVMLVCDAFAALCTVTVLVLLHTGRLAVWQLYVLNALNGLMNTIQQPAADVAVTLLTPRRRDQTVSGLRSFSGALVNLLSPVFAAALLGLAGLDAVICFDLVTFAVAAVTLLGWIRIPDAGTERRRERPLRAARAGLRWLGENRGILHLMLFLAVINFTVAVYNAALPAMLLSRAEGGETVLGWVNAMTGAATLLGSLLAAAMPTPKHRARVVCNTLLFSMSTENFLLGFGRSAPLWCLGAVLGWICIPLMNANLDAIFRSTIPVELQGRVFAARNTLQFFTIPLGYLVGGLLVDRVFEPLMAAQEVGSLLLQLFGSGKGAGAALLFAVLGCFGTLSCLPFRFDRAILRLDA